MNVEAPHKGMWTKFFFCIMTNCAGENETQEGDEIAM